MEATIDVDLVFAALSDGTRRDILRRAMNGEEGVQDLAGHYPMSFAAVQKHIAVLERAGLITKHRSGRRKLIRTRMAAMREAQRLLDHYEELWRGRVDLMEEIISETKENRDAG